MRQRMRKVVAALVFVGLVSSAAAEVIDRDSLRTQSLKNG